MGQQASILHIDWQNPSPAPSGLTEDSLKRPFNLAVQFVPPSKNLVAPLYGRRAKNRLDVQKVERVGTGRAGDLQPLLTMTAKSIFNTARIRTSCPSKVFDRRIHL
jgi:hypothetical protein